MVLTLAASHSSDPLEPSLFYQEAPHACSSFPRPWFFILWIPQRMDMLMCSFSKNQWWERLRHSFSPTAPSPLTHCSSHLCSKTQNVCLPTAFTPPLTALNKVTDKLYVAIPKVMYLLPSCNLNSQELSKKGPLPHSSNIFLPRCSTPTLVSSYVPAHCFSLSHAPLPWPRLSGCNASNLVLLLSTYSLRWNTICVLVTSEASVRTHTANNQKSNSVLSNKGGLWLPWWLRQ